MAEVEAVWEKLRAGANANADQLANADVVKVFKIYARLDAQDHIPPLRLAQHFLINAKWTLAKDNAEFVIARLQRPGPLSEIEAEHLGEAGSIFHEARVHLAEQDQYAEISVKRSANGCHNLRSTATLAYQQEPVHFKLDSAQLDGIGEKAVAQLARDLIDCPLTNPMLVGHTDPNAAAAYNCDLAKRRVETVREKLLVLGVPGAASIQLLWLGEAVPYSPSSAQKTRLQALNESARQSEHYSLDRRVELISREWSTATAALCGAKMKERKP